jgi:hypothetical protein
LANIWQAQLLRLSIFEVKVQYSHWRDCEENCKVPNCVSDLGSKLYICIHGWCTAVLVLILIFLFFYSGFHYLVLILGQG